MYFTSSSRIPPQVKTRELQAYSQSIKKASKNNDTRTFKLDSLTVSE
jgi:hypothetical protein